MAPDLVLRANSIGLESALKPSRARRPRLLPSRLAATAGVGALFAAALPAFADRGLRDLALLVAEARFEVLGMAGSSRTGGDGRR